MPQPSTQSPEPTRTAPDPLAALRAATADQHARLDAALPLARTDATLADYLLHLRAVGAWLQALTPSLQALDATGAPALTLDDATRLQTLHSDLRDGNDTAALQPSAATQAALDAALAAHPEAADAVRWGFAYVVEGSQLGGQVLYRALSAPLAPHPLRYLRGHADGTGARWKAFMATLRAQVQGPAAVQAACTGAQAAFRGLQQHLLTVEGVAT